MTNYVAGFLFDHEGQVALVQKNRPRWQAGKLNGIGGHVEAGETFEEAMRREFREETGLYVPTWVHFATLKGSDFTVAFFFSGITYTAILHRMTDEAVFWCPVDGVNRVNAIPNLTWLIPMARNFEGKPLLIQEN